MKTKHVSDFKTFVNESYSNTEYKKGNIVEDKDGRIALIISDAYIDSDEDNFYGDEEGFDLYYRSLGGDIFFVGKSDIKSLYEPYEDNYSHISSYKSIADNNGFDIIIPDGFDDNGHKIDSDDDY
jgi:hypothetical protein